MLSVADAQARLLALAHPGAVEQVPLVDAVGRWAAEPILARRDQPAADLSAMDGYALRFADLPGPWTIVGESAAGAGLDRAVGEGEAARIFTGAPLPDGADTILIQEETTRDGDRLLLTGDAPAYRGLHVRRRGGDFRTGATLIDVGVPLTPARIALAAAAGHGTLPVRRRPRVAIISTGDELVPPGVPTHGVMLPASNGPMLATLLATSAAEVEDAGIVRDELATLAVTLAATAERADILVTIGGASVGDRDLVRPALEQAGATLDFWKVAMRPGKPLIAGRIGKTIVLGLPGNPVSAFVTACLFLRPLVDHLAGSPAPLPKARTLPLAAPLPANGPRAAYLRGIVRGHAVHIAENQDSAGLSVLATADGLAVRPAGAPAADAGTLIEIIDIA